MAAPPSIYIAIATTPQHGQGGLGGAISLHYRAPVQQKSGRTIANPSLGGRAPNPLRTFVSCASPEAAQGRRVPRRRLPAIGGTAAPNWLRWLRQPRTPGRSPRP